LKDEEITIESKEYFDQLLKEGGYSIFTVYQ